MPSVLEDPSSFVKRAVPSPIDIRPRQVTLRDQAVATLMPFPGADHMPQSLLTVLCAMVNEEIEAGDTYPMTEQMSVDEFAKYWVGHFAAVLLLGDAETVHTLLNANTSQHTFAEVALGTFYIKPNYPGRCSHVSNGGFLVSPLQRNRGIGRLLGEGYVEWAPRLNYTYSVFNLVFETNTYSMRLWQSLGFSEIGRVRGCGALRSYPGQLVDAIQYGKDFRMNGDGGNDPTV